MEHLQSNSLPPFLSPSCLFLLIACLNSDPGSLRSPVFSSSAWLSNRFTFVCFCRLCLLPYSLGYCCFSLNKPLLFRTCIHYELSAWQNSCKCYYTFVILWKPNEIYIHGGVACSEVGNDRNMGFTHHEHLNLWKDINKGSAGCSTEVKHNYASPPSPVNVYFY